MDSNINWLQSVSFKTMEKLDNLQIHCTDGYLKKASKILFGTALDAAIMIGALVETILFATLAVIAKPIQLFSFEPYKYFAKRTTLSAKAMVKGVDHIFHRSTLQKKPLEKNVTPPALEKNTIKKFYLLSLSKIREHKTKIAIGASIVVFIAFVYYFHQSIPKEIQTKSLAKTILRKKIGKIKSAIGKALRASIDHPTTSLKKLVADAYHNLLKAHHNVKKCIEIKETIARSTVTYRGIIEKPFHKITKLDIKVLPLIKDWLDKLHRVYKPQYFCSF